MNQEQIQQAPRDEPLVPTNDRVKIGSSNMRLDSTLIQTEETYQLILDIIKTSSCYNAFLIIADVAEIYIQQFWFIIKRVKRSTKIALRHVCDYMHQPWRTLETIINKCLFGKTSSNNRLQKSRVEILWGLFHKKNVDFAALIWEYFQYQIDYMQTKLRRREIMPYPRFTKINLHYFLSQHKSISKRQGSYVNIIKEDDVLVRLKFIGKGEETQVYGLAIPDTMLNEDIKNSEAYQTYIALSTGLIPPEKGRDEALKLGKSISKNEAEIAEEERLVHETYKSIITEKSTSDEGSDDEQEVWLTRRRPPGVVFRDTSNVSKKKSLDQTQKLKGSSEGAGIRPEVPDESKGKTTTSSEGAGIESEVPDEAKGSSVAKVDAKIDWGSEDESDRSDSEEVNEGEIEWLSSDDEEEIHDDDDDNHDDRGIDIEEINDDERTKSDDVDQVMDDAEKNDTEKAEGEQDVDKEPTRAEQVSTVKETVDTEINYLLDVKIRQEIPSILSAPLLDVLVSVVPSQTTPTPLTTPLPPPPSTSEAPTVTTAIPDPLPAVVQRLSDLENKFKAWSKVDHSEVIHNSVKNQVPAVVSEFIKPRLESTI
ncbi:hypothetical protein Tco_0863690 [Tanacetum coccineum]